MANQLDMRNALNELAFRQAGYFTARQASEFGFSAQSQKYHADRGTWVRVGRGLYRLAKWPASESDVYTRWFVWSDRAGVISHDSAAAVHALGDLDPRRVHLTFPAPRRTRLPGVTLHSAELDDSDIEGRESFRVTTPTRTVFDLAGAPVTQEQFAEVLFDALDRSLTTMSELANGADDFGPAAAIRIERALAAYRSERA